MDDLANTVDALSSARDETQWCAPLLDFLPVTGVSISTLGFVLSTETVAASDATAARIDEVQFDLGEGPCWDAVNTRRPILAGNLHDKAEETWPSFSPPILEAGVDALFVFPLLLGPLGIGAIELYSTVPSMLTGQQQDHMSQLARIVSRKVLRRAVTTEAQEDPTAHFGTYSRREIHQATGFVLAQVGLSPSDAELLIQGRAFSEGRSMLAIAQDILQGRLTFRRHDTDIEDHE